MSERYVLLGLARARAPWFTEVASWCTSGALPAHFLKCISIEELRARLGSGRNFSALLVDTHLGALDRDLVELARSRGCAVFVVDDDVHPSTVMSDIDARLSSRFDRAELLDALATNANFVPDTSPTLTDPVLPVRTAPWEGQLVAVCGPGGTGSSTIAAAIAQAFGADPRHGGLVLLADLALHADQAMLHGTDDIMPGIPEVVDAFRRGIPDPEELHRLTFQVPRRTYRLLLGLRRHRDWSALRQSSFDTALHGLRQAFQVVVTDIDADVEGERQCGIAELDERNLMARRVTGQADVVVVVCGPGLKGVHAGARTVTELLDAGVDATCLVAVCNRSSKRPPTRAAFTRTFSALVPQLATSPVFVPERSGVDELHRDGSPFPTSLTNPVFAAVRHVLDQQPTHARSAESAPERIVPGDLGSWPEHDAAAQ